ncbi:MAG: type III-B CRISPR module RAMP protein Cmr1 [Gemmatales bacterium]|nr:type III-B CRISPR module RAMP protein Cmr1 [Gemmatales bacterium]
MRLECRVEVELITPGFFAGAEQFGPEAQKGCDLRSATLRGLLRWWWRTLHAGFVSVSILRRLEAAIWGDTECGGAVQIIVRPLGDPVVEAYDKRNKANFDNSQKRSNYGIPNSDPTKTTQGLWYLSYGMDEQIRGQHRRRNYLAPGMRWAIVFRIRRAIWQPPLRNKKPEEKVIISPQQVLNQALAALWLLCHFGGVGAKSRKGFGSLQIVVSPEEWSLEKCKQVGRDLRQRLGLGNQFTELYYHSPSIEYLIGPIEVAFTWPDIWLVLDQIGFAYQAFAKRYAHNLEKRALGLPRRIGQPLKGSFELRKPVKDTNRHASPVCIHVAKQGDKYIIRVVAFPAPYLPDLSQSTKFLGEFMKYVEAELKKRSSLSLPQVSSRSSGPASSSSSSSSSPTSPYRTGQEVKAVLLAERTKKGGWKARIVGSSLEGPIVNSNEVPADKKPGEEIAVVIQSISGREAMFRYVPSSPESKRS